MTLLETITLIPYGVAILLKTANYLFSSKIAMNAMDRLFSLPKPSGEGPRLTKVQRQVLVKHLSCASLKSTAILSSLTSLFAAAVIIAEAKAGAWAICSLLGFLVLGVVLFYWIYPKEVFYFDQPSVLHIRGAAIITIVLCFFDILLALLSFAVIPHSW